MSAAGGPVLAYIGLGANLGDPERQVRAGLAALSTLPDSERVAVSSLYANPPLGPVAQPDFVNAVAGVRTRLSARALLGHLRAIEEAHGRRRDGERWGPRTLDLDILLFGEERIEEPGLSIPHPGVPVRNFVLYPLAEIAPGLTVPGHGPLAALVAACPAGEMRRIPEAR